MYTVLINKSIEKDIRRLGTVDQARVHKAILSLSRDPRPQGKKIKPFFCIEHGYRLRVGAVRVLYVVDDEGKEIKIVEVGYRSTIY